MSSNLSKLQLGICYLSVGTVWWMCTR